MDATSDSDTESFEFSESFYDEQEEFSNINTQRSNSSSERSYSMQWENDSRFERWVGKCPNNQSRAFCIWCEQSLYPSSKSLKRHYYTSKHQKNAFIHGLPDDGPQNPEEQLTIDVAKAGFKIAAMYAVRNLSFLLANYEIPLLKQVIPDSAIMKKVVLNTDRIRDIIIKVLTPAHKSYLQEILQEQRFSIIIDESTDISVSHALCIIVRFNHEVQGRIVEILWDYKPIYLNENSRADAETLANIVVTSFEDAGILLENIMSFCADTCNVMMGSRHSVSVILKTKIPELLIEKCNWHIGHLSAKNAFENLPHGVRSVIFDIPKYIKASAARKAMWFHIQQRAGLKPLNMLQAFLTRWLTIAACNRRILRRKSILIQYYIAEYQNYRAPRELVPETSPWQILAYLQDPQVYLYLLFLDFALMKMECVNGILQSEAPIFGRDKPIMKQTLLDFFNMYMYPESVQNVNLSEIDPMNETAMRNLRSISLGPEKIDEQHPPTLSRIINADNLTEEQKDEILTNCRSFMITVCFQLQSRLTFDQPWVDVRNYFHPSNALSQEFHRTHEDLDTVFEAYPTFVTAADRRKINTEWKSLMECDFDEEIRTEKEADVFWNKMTRYVNVEGNQLFINLADFVITTFLIPNSNASAERAFSKQNLEKIKPRNRLHILTLEGLMKASAYVSLTGGLLNFIISKSMLKAHMKLQRGYTTARTGSGLQLETVEKEFAIDQLTLVAAREEYCYYKSLSSGKRKRRRNDLGPLGGEKQSRYNHSNISGN